VPAQRQVVRDLEGRSPDEPSVHGSRFDENVELRQVTSAAAGPDVDLDPGRNRVAVRHVHRNRPTGAAAQDDGRRQHPAPLVVGAVVQLHLCGGG